MSNTNKKTKIEEGENCRTENLGTSGKYPEYHWIVVYEHNNRTGKDSGEEFSIYIKYN